nr:hypothetical protein [Tanacetum cinerariifolium]
SQSQPLKFLGIAGKRFFLVQGDSGGGGEGDRYTFDLSKALPLQGRPGHLTIATDYFFNNNLEYLKYFDPERTYTTSITKSKVARFEIVDRTLKKVRDEIHHKVLDFRLGYNKEMSRRKWMAIDRKRSQLMVEHIDKQIRE